MVYFHGVLERQPPLKQVLRSWPLTLALSVLLPAAQAPQFEAETLSGKRLLMPQATQGKVSLLIMGFTQGSSRQTSDWAKKTQPLSDSGLCEVWSMALLEAVPRLLRGMVVRGIRSGVPKDRQDHFLIVYRSEDEVKKAVGYSPGLDADAAWLLLLGKNGTIQWQYHGVFSEDAFDTLRKQLR